MRVSIWDSRALALGVLFAAIGFCFAFSTQPVTASGGHSAGSRAVGASKTLQFTNPFVSIGGVPVSTEFDLGDGLFGSSITRYFTADGGLRPYRFTSEGPSGLTSAIEGTSSSLQLGTSGVLVGSLPGSLTAASTTVLGTPGLRFQAAVTDARTPDAVTTTGVFNLFLFNPSNVYRFATDTLPQGQLASNYIARADVLGGLGPITYTLLSVFGTTAGPIPNLEDIGLVLSSDGTISGKPLMPGTFQITVRATDAQSQIAKNRANAANDQTYTLIVNPNPITSSDLVTLKARVTGNLFGFQHDSLSYRGIINLQTRTHFDLNNSEFIFRLGGIVLSGRLDRRGVLKTKLPDGTNLNVRVDQSNGIVSVSASGGSFATALNAQEILGGASRRSVSITVGDVVVASESLDFLSAIHPPRFDLTYNIETSTNAGGAFQIIAVQGKDGIDIVGRPGDAWRVNFVAIPRFGVNDGSNLVQGFNTVNSMTLRVGQLYSQTIGGGALSFTGGKLGFRGSATDGVKAFSLDTNSSKGSMTTRVLPRDLTGIPLAESAASFGPLYFSLGMDIVGGEGVAPFTGEHSRRIFGQSSKYFDRLTPKR